MGDEAPKPSLLDESPEDIFKPAPPPTNPEPEPPVASPLDSKDIFDDVEVNDEIDLSSSGDTGAGKMGTLQLDDSDDETPPAATNGKGPASPLEEPSPPPPAVIASPVAAAIVPPAAKPVAALASKPVASLVSKPVAAAKTEEAVVFEPTPVGLEITIVEFEKKGEGMHAYVVFKVQTKVDNVVGFKKAEYVVFRRFSDFLGLHEKLVMKHTTVGRIVPPPPEKSVVGTTKTKWAGQDEDQAANEFLERRKNALQRFLRRIVQHPSFLQDPDVRDFLTLESDLPKSTGTSALSAQGVKKMFGKVGDTFTKMAFRMDETDRWYEEKTNEIEELDESLRKLQGSVDSLLHYRRELASSTEAFCKAMGMLAACEENTALSRAFSQLAETQEKVALVQAQQADKDYFILYETLRDYIALIATVKEVLYERVKVWNRWQNASADLNKKRELKTRLELAGKTDKLPQAKQDVATAEAKVKESEEEFERISKQIRKEMVRFDGQRVLDFKAALLEYLDSLALTQQQLVKYWEAFLPEAKAIIS